ncbi:MAG: hypothetical protein A2156_13930 [Deltaproteobacteria bacterium RBG_16_48_10]|nr:MAG: hypothetical protein A2156_13930 [Deltaproteobacteria bacterium RBG_16_48_10]
MRFPTIILEGKKLPRMIFSLQPPTSHGDHEIYPLMKKIYEMGSWCFDLPSANHLDSFKELRYLTTDLMLIGLCHLDAEEGSSLLGKPLRRFESKIISTIRKDLLPPHLARSILPPSISPEVFTQKEIDRITFDPLRFEEALSRFDPEESPFLLIGEKYGVWLLALGRIDLLHEMVSKVREKGFIPIFSGQWATFVLPKAKPLHVAAYAVPINKKWSLFDLQRASDLIKKFDKPVISLNPLADGTLLNESVGAFSFLFDELKIYAAISKITSEGEANKIVEALMKFPSLIPPRKT